MPWQLFDTEQNGQPVQMMLEDSFRDEVPGAELPKLSRIRVWFAKTPDDYFWHPEESNAIEDIEDALLRLADQYGDGWAVFVYRQAERGFFDYFFYAGGEAKLDAVVPELAATHSEQRFEYEERSDPTWSAYRDWLARLPANQTAQYSPLN